MYDRGIYLYSICVYITSYIIRVCGILAMEWRKSVMLILLNGARVLFDTVLLYQIKKYLLRGSNPRLWA